MSPAMLAAWRFFMAQGSGAASALHLARAEARADDAGLIFRWEADDLAYDTFVDHDEWCRKDCGKDHEVLWCAVSDGGSETLASLGSIIDASRDYRRVIEAELASEALATMDANDVAIAG
jgi:hypothetical protein